MAVSRTRLLVEVAMTIALATALHFVKVWQMPAGGSVSLEMLPIVVLGLRRGLRPALLAGALYGGVDYLMEPYFVHWVQLLLDYPVAFGLVGLAGLLRPFWTRVSAITAAGRRVSFQLLVAASACVVATAARFVAHFTSGLVFFASSAPAGQPAWLYSVIYNATYLVPSCIAIAVAAAAVLPTLERAFPSEAVS
jgi:thiamine transporter